MGWIVISVCAAAIIYLVYNCVTYQRAAKHVMVIEGKKNKNE